MTKLKQKTEGIINFKKNGIDFELLTIMLNIILENKELGPGEFYNGMEYQEWFKYFEERSKGHEISEKQIILVLDYLKLNYEKSFSKYTPNKGLNMMVKSFSKIEHLDPEFTKNVYDTIEMWENSKK